MVLRGLLENAVGDACESCELVPRQPLDLVLRHVSGTRAPLQGTHEWHVLVEAVAPMVAPDPEKEFGRALRAALAIGVVEDAVIAAAEAQAEACCAPRDSLSEAAEQDGTAANNDF